MTNPEPMTVRVNPGPPAVALDGVYEMMEIGEPVMKVRALEMAPVDTCTVILAVPGLAIKVPGTAAANWVALKKDVANAISFHRTVVAKVNPEPLTVKIKLPEPGAAPEGLRLVIVGEEEGAMVKLSAFDTAFPGLVAVMVAEPADTVRFAGTTAVN